MQKFRMLRTAARYILPIVFVLALAGMASSEQADHEMVTVPKSELEAEIDSLREEMSLETGAQEPVETEPFSDYDIPAPSITAPAGGRQMMLPDISVVGDIVGKFSTDGDDDDRNSFMVREIELAFQGYLYPQVRADVFIALGDDNDYQAELEEGYVSFLQLGNTDLNATLGKRRVDFGRINRIHPHHWPYVDAPRVIQNFLGDDGLIGQGASIGYLLPTPGRLFANIDFGAWRANGDDDEDGLGIGFDDRFYTSRLWTSYPVAADSELELGVSGAWGATGDPDDGNANILGLDLTYRQWPGSYQRILLQGEVYRHSRAGQNRYGYYLFGNYKWDQYWDVGLLYDWSERPFPSSGRDSGISAILTNQLTETTSLRLQVTRGFRADAGQVTEGMLQMVWGIGPHSHPLE